MRVGSRRVRVRKSDLDAFIEAGSTLAAPTEPSMAPVDKASIAAWATLGATMAKATATLEKGDRAELVGGLESLSRAARELAEALRAAADD